MESVKYLCIKNRRSTYTTDQITSDLRWTDYLTVCLGNVTMLFVINRVLVMIASISVWHQQINEKLFSGTLDANVCRLFASNLFLVALLVHFAATSFSFGFFKRVSNFYYAMVNILFGAFIVMAFKPPTWYFSFQWDDCHSLYESNNVVNRTVFFSYTLIVLGTLELLEAAGSGAPFGVEWQPNLLFSMSNVWFLVLVGVVCFALCWAMVMLAQM
jgi:hypothetical protein